MFISCGTKVGLLCINLCSSSVGRKAIQIQRKCVLFQFPLY
jgi:hypothetical protein